jgi:hypothetical protein
MPLNINRWLFVRLYILLGLLNLFICPNPCSVGFKTERANVSETQLPECKTNRNRKEMESVIDLLG